MRQSVLVVVAVLSGCSLGQPGSSGGASKPPLAFTAPTGTALKATITMSQDQRGGRSASSVGASFAATVLMPASPNCTTQEADACHLITCPAPTPGFGAEYAIPRQLVAPPTIRVDGGLRPVLITPLQGQTYAFGNFNSQLWKGGEQLTVSGASDMVPQFAMTLTAPSTVVFESPLPMGGTRAIAVASGEGMAVKWRGGAIGTLQVKLTTPTKAATCSYDAAAGNAIIPADALAFLGAGTTATMLTSLTSSKTVSNNNWDITVNAIASPTFIDGSRASASVVIQ